MTPEAQEQITKALTMINDAASTSSNFVLEQAPQLARELVAYELWSSLVWLIIACAVLIFSSIKIPRWIERVDSDQEIFPAIGTLVLGFLAVAMLVTFVTCLNSSVKAAFAPRLVILDYVKGMVK